MTKEPGSRFGPYEIVGLIGAGGMGEVYRARDTKLGRDVAIKLLPDTYLEDRDRRARFTREAQILAALNHPHIAAIYGLEDSSTPALVMEFVEGPTLADRIRPGRVPVREAINIARQARPRTRRRARARHHPPRSQAGQRQDCRRRDGQGARLRPREIDAGRRPDRWGRRRLTNQVGNGH